MQFEAITIELFLGNLLAPKQQKHWSDVKKSNV